MWKTRCQPAVLGICANQAEDGRLSGQHVLLDNARGEPIEENHHRLHRNNGLRFVTGWQTCLSFCVELSFSLSLSPSTADHRRGQASRGPPGNPHTHHKAVARLPSACDNPICPEDRHPECIEQVCHQLPVSGGSGPQPDAPSKHV